MNRVKLVFSLVIILLSIVIISIWQFFYSDKINYYVISFAFLLLSILPFFISFEMKSINSREITLMSTLIALAVVSRAAFYLIPQVKPIAAVVIVSAVCLGAERGYIIGAFSAFISNFLFTQGPWTVFQMAALGAVGFVAGAVFKYVKVNRITLSVLGFLLSFALYGLIVDISTVLVMYGDNLSLKSVLSVYIAGFSFSLIFGISTAVFLFLFGNAFIKKINRITTKYNILSNSGAGI